MSTDQNEASPIPPAPAVQAAELIRGTFVEAATEPLDPATAERMRTYYDPVDVYVGIHSMPKALIDELLKDEKLKPYAEAADKELNAVRDLVLGMEPGDTLFVELFGFANDPPWPFPQLPELPSHDAALGTDIGSISMAFAGAYLEPVYRDVAARHAKRQEAALREVEALRESRQIDTWGYAELLAQIRGVRIVYADFDTEKAEAARALLGGRHALEILSDPDASEEDLALVTAIATERTHEGRNIIQAHSIAHLPPVGAPIPRTQASPCVSHWGRAHR